LARRQASEQNFTSSQVRAQRRRQVIGRPQAAQGLLGRAALLPRNAGARGVIGNVLGRDGDVAGGSSVHVTRNEFRGVSSWATWLEVSLKRDSKPRQQAGRCGGCVKPTRAGPHADIRPDVRLPAELESPGPPRPSSSSNRLVPREPEPGEIAIRNLPRYSSGDDADHPPVAQRGANSRT
jgi:hypothetical protein